MILSDYNVINDILNEMHQEIVLLDDAIKENLRYIKETDIYTRSLKESESEEYKIFSPRNVETIRKDEINKAYHKKSDYEVKVDSLRQRRAVIGDRIDRLNRVLENQKKESFDVKSLLDDVISDINNKSKYDVKIDVDNIIFNSYLSLFAVYDIIQDCFRFIDRYVITNQVLLNCKECNNFLIIDISYNEKEYRKKNDKEKEDYWNRSSVVKKIILIHGKFQYSPDIQMGNKIHIELPL